MRPDPASPGTSLAWKMFVREHGWRANNKLLAHLLEQPVPAIIAARVAVKRLATPRTFEELFALWHGRAPVESDWPVPWRIGGQYVWFSPELTLLASLVGQLTKTEISGVLTERLVRLTGDPAAVRTPTAVLVAANRIGLQMRDVVGGILQAEAAREVGSLSSVLNAVAHGELQTVHLGQHVIIDRASWEAWKQTRRFPPTGFVMLSTYRERLGIKSDKLSEFARMGYVPTAVRCNPVGQGPSTQFGTWWIDPKAGEQLLADRRAGRPMPWHGMPMRDNLKQVFKRWTERRHPDTCPTCRQIWGKAGPPATLEAFIAQYPPLAFGAKRHLTRVHSQGLTVDEIAKKAGVSPATVRRAIDNGQMLATRSQGRGRALCVTATEVSRWIHRGAPAGAAEKSWIALETAIKRYTFTRRQLLDWIIDGTLKSKIGTHGAANGIHYVPKNACARLRERLGFTLAEAARRVGVSRPAMRRLLEGVNWRGETGIPLFTVQAACKRRDSREGRTIEETAAALNQPVEWVLAQRDCGLIRLRKTAWSDRLYVTDGMFARLERELACPQRRAVRWSPEWLRLEAAAREAGVCTTTILKWVDGSKLPRQQGANGWRYHRDDVRTIARSHWLRRLQRQGQARAQPPAWFNETGEHHA